jgi:hypothetical protein
MELAMTELEQPDPNKGRPIPWVYVDKPDAEFDPDPSSCGLTPEMLKEAYQLYTMTFVSKSPVDKLAAEVFYKDVDFEKRLAEGTTEGAPAE